MSLLRRASLSALRNFRPRAAHGPKESYFSQGSRTDRNGYLFTETPLPPGQSRKWESWELSWYTFTFGGIAILAFGLPARPESSWVGAAREEATKRLKESGTI